MASYICNFINFLNHVIPRFEDDIFVIYFFNCTQEMILLCSHIVGIETPINVSDPDMEMDRTKSSNLHIFIFPVNTCDQLGRTTSEALIRKHTTLLKGSINSTRFFNSVKQG